jgi:DNA/RNA-binding domain of Phe-tRNA-synthetase-like protein
MFTVSEAWRKAYPDAHVGILAMGKVSNLPASAALEEEKKVLEQDLRALFRSPEELKTLEPIRAYQAYYKRFKKTYHVLAQLESVVFKGKEIPKVATLVEAMFMEELRNMLLTAGHDLALIEEPLRLDVAQGTETYVRLNGQDQAIKAGDMFIADARGVISSIIYGPDRRTMIRKETTRVLFTAYGVPGVGHHQVLQHLQGIERNVKLAIPDAQTEVCEVLAP